MYLDLHGLEPDQSKIRRRFLGALLLLLLAAPLSAGAQEGGVSVALSLEAALERGLQANPRILAYELGVDISREELRGAYGAFLPTLTMSHGETRLRNDSDVEFDNDYLDQRSRSSSAGSIRRMRISQPSSRGSLLTSSGRSPTAALTSMISPLTGM